MRKAASFLGRTFLAGLLRARYLEALAADLKQVRLPGHLEPLDLERVYLPPRLREERQDWRTTQPPPKKLWEVLLRSSPHLLILGPAGSGKTALLKWLALQFARDKVPPDVAEHFGLKHPVPIFVDLHRFATSRQTLLEYLADRLSEHQFPHSEGFLQDQLQAGQCVLLFDGLNRVSSEVANSIVRFAGQYKDALILVTSRPVDHRELGGFIPFSLLGFDEGEQEAFLQKRFGEKSERADRLLAVLERNPRMRALASTPFFLAMLANAFERKGSWPVSCAALLGEVAAILLVEGVDPEAHPRFDVEIKRQALQELAFHLHNRGEQAIARDELLSMTTTVFPVMEQDSAALLDELEGTGLLRRKDDGAYEFAHLTWQEFLVAQALVARGEEGALLERMDDPWWREVLVLAAGLQESVVDFAATIRTKSQNPAAALVLAGRCLAEAREVDPETRTRMLEELLEVFAKDEPDLWGEAAAAVAGIGQGRTRTVFAGLLEDAESAIRVQACQALGRVSAHWAVMRLAGLLEIDKDPRVREMAAWALGQIGDHRAIPSLARALRDENREVGLAVAEALSAIGEPTIEELLKALRDESRRKTAVIALGRIGEPAVAPVLKMFKDPDANVRTSAVDAVVQIGPPALDQLSAALMDLTRFSVSEKELIATALGRIGESAVGILREAALEHQEARVRKLAMEALGNICVPSAWLTLIQALGDLEIWVSEAAAQVLRKMASAPEIQDQVIEALILALREQRVVSKVKEVLTAIGSRAVKPLLEALQHEDKRIRGEAAEVLGCIKDEQAIPVLITILTDQDRDVRQRVVRALGTFGDEVIEKPLREALYKGGEPDPALVEPIAAIRTEAARRILTLLLEEEDPEIRVRAFRALEIYYGVSAVDLYTFWKPIIQERLLKRGAVSTHDLVGVAEPFARVCLRKYLEDNKEVNLISLEELGIFEIRLKNHGRIQQLFDSWETARSLLRRDVFVHCTAELAKQFASLLGLSLIRPMPEEHGDLCAYVLDISGVVKNITTNVPDELLLVFSRSGEFGEKELRDLHDLLINQMSRQYKISLLFLFGESEALKLAKQLCDNVLLPERHNVVVIGKSDFQRIIIAKDCRKLLLSTIVQQADLTTISPFVTIGPVPAHMFFGRKSEIANVLESIKRSSLAVVGGRRIGKTSFLQEVERQLGQLSAQCRYHPIYVSCQGARSYKDFMDHIRMNWPVVNGLYDPGSFYTAVASALHSEVKTLIFLIDEIEALLEFDVSQGEQLVKTFRDLFNEFQNSEHGCRFIISGERYLNQQLEAGSSPLLNFCEVLLLGFLDPENAKEIISRPMEEMNIEIQADILGWFKIG